MIAFLSAPCPSHSHNCTRRQAPGLPQRRYKVTKNIDPQSLNPHFFFCHAQGGGIGRGYIPYYIYRRRRIRFAIRWWSRLGENGISCCLFLHQTTTILHGYLKSLWLYIVRFLHQTTTIASHGKVHACCISSVSYIKPQQTLWQQQQLSVVYRPFPTSNHNTPRAVLAQSALYIVRFLHQTTTFL